MRKKLAKTVVTMLCVSMVLGMAGCGSDNKADKSADVTKEAESMTEAPKEDTQTEEVSLKMGDTYEFENLPKGTVDTPLNFVSEDATVAEVAQGKYIVAHNVGDTVVTVTCGTDTYTYNVSVTSEQSRLLEAPDIRDKTVYVGAGYNALECKQYPSFNDINVSRSIITPKIINKFRASYKKHLEQLVDEEDLDPEIIETDDLILMDGTNSDTLVMVQTEDVNGYGDKYEQAISGALNVNIKDIINGKAELNMNTTTDNTKKKSYLYNSAIAMCQRYKFFLNAPTEYLTAMAQNNKSAWKRLTDPEVKPARVFDLYGTHIITDARIGGRAQLDYVMSMDEDKTSSSEMLEVGGEIGVNVSVVEAKGSGNYKQGKTKELLNKGLNINSTAKIFGGKSTTAKMITDIESFSSSYGSWYNSLDASSVTFIGVSQTGLLPIWELLPDEEQYEERREQLRTAYYTMMGQPLPEDKYTIKNKNESAEKIFDSVNGELNK